MENEKKVTETPALPEMTDKHKVSLLSAHRTYILAKAAFSEAERELNLAAQSIVTELGVDGSKVILNVDTLNLSPK